LIRVLHVDSGRTFRGGQRQLRLLAVSQRLGGDVEPWVLASEPQLLRELDEAGVPTRRWRGPGSLQGLAALGRAAAKLRPDIVHVHDSRAHGAAIVAASGCPLVVHRRIDDPPRARRITRAKYRRGTIICVSRAVADVLCAAGVGRDRLHVVPSAVPVPRLPPSRPPRSDPLRLLAVGAQVAHKGHDILLEALAAAIEPMALVLAGDGPRAAHLHHLASRLGLLHRVRFVPFRAGLMEQADLFVQPSRTEGLGTAVLDAMAAALPVVASRVGGLGEAVIDQQTGWLVPPEDPSALAQALDRAAREDSGRFAACGEAGHARVRASHTVAAMLAGVNAVYDGIRDRA
jgi:glycosyltransferase involved in cell wall biosynthesis